MIDVVIFYYNNWDNLKIKDTKKLAYQYLDTFVHMLGRYMPGMYRLILYTDDPQYYNEYMCIRLLPVYMNKWKRKKGIGMNLKRMYVWKEDEDISDHVMVFDPDIIIKGDLTPLTQLDGLLFTNINSKGNGPGGGVYISTKRRELADKLWTPVVENFNKAFEESMGGRDRIWVKSKVKNYKYIQKECPGVIVSYKKSNGKDKDKAAILWTHGSPKPHQLNHPAWV